MTQMSGHGLFVVKIMQEFYVRLA